MNADADADADVNADMDANIALRFNTLLSTSLSIFNQSYDRRINQSFIYFFTVWFSCVRSFDLV